jgi:tryptophanyl-tRNA synthetase
MCVRVAWVRAAWVCRFEHVVFYRPRRAIRCIAQIQLFMVHMLQEDDYESIGSDEDIVDPWTVHAKSPSGLDLNKLIRRFGATPVGQELIDCIERVTQRKAHYLLRRGHFFSHRNLETIILCHETGMPFYLYTSRSPAMPMHIGQLVPLIFTKWLQEIFSVPVIIQITDDDKSSWEDLSLEETRRISIENVKDTIAIGFDVNKTFIFVNSDVISAEYYQNMCRIWKSLPLKRVKRIFDMSDAEAAGKVAFPAIQAAPAFSSSFPLIFGGKPDVPCLIPCAFDQDAFFRMARYAAPKLGFPKPSLIHSNFIPALQGAQSKMSCSEPKSCIYVTDTVEEIRNKIASHAFSGGRATEEEHRQFGGDCDVDVSFKILSFFLEDDDKFEDLTMKYKRGELLPSELKKEAMVVVEKLVSEYRVRRGHVTDELIRQFMTPRVLLSDGC